MKRINNSKLLAIFLSVCLLFSVLPMAGISVYAADPVFDTDGTTILISTPAELAAIGVDANFPRDGSYALSNDIDLSSYGNWTPLCGGFAAYNASTAFIGSFDGRGYTIKGMTISGEASIASVGLFCGVGAKVDNVKTKGYIKNIVFDSCVIDVHGGTSVYAGVVAGTVNNDGGADITNIAVINSSVKGTSNNALNGSGVASIVGWGTMANLVNCYSDAELIGGCYAEGNTQFGIAGMIGMSWRGYANTDGCVFNGTIDNSIHAASDMKYANGIFAYNSNQTQPSYVTDSNRFVDSYYNSDKLTVSTATNGGEINGTAKTSDELKAAYPADLGLDMAYWCNIGDGPILRVALNRTLSGFGDEIALYDAHDLAKIGKDSAFPLNGSYVLANDIDMSKYGNWTPIAYTTKHSSDTNYTVDGICFTGSFNGAGHTISNMNVSFNGGNTNVGLFGAVWGAKIGNFILKDSSVATTNNDRAYAGAVAGTAIYTVDSVFENIAVVNTSVSVQGKNATLPILAGGICGQSLGKNIPIKNCYVEADVSATFVGTDYAKQTALGGFVGGSYKEQVTVENSVFAGTLDNQNIAAGYAGEAPVANFKRQNSVLGADTQGFGKDDSEINNNNIIVKDVYYIDTIGVNTANTRGTDGTPISASDYAAAAPAALGLSSAYWYNNGSELTLKINGGKAAVDGFDGYIAISNAEELASIGSGLSYPLSGNYVLANDIDLSSVANWKPIGSSGNFYADTAFVGTIDGNGNKIINLNISLGSATTNRVQAAFIGSASGATVKNIIFDGASVSAEAASNAFVAVVVGYSDKAKTTLENIAVVNTTVNGKSNSAEYESGIASLVAGGTDVIIKNCYSEADITAECTASGTGYLGVAGMLGYMWRGIATVDGCIFNGTINNTVADGTANVYANGIMALNKQFEKYPTPKQYYTNCYYNSDKLTVSTATNGNEVNGTALTAVELATKKLSALSLDENYWVNTYEQPELKILGGTEYIVADINKDGSADLLDLVRIKKYLADNNVEASLVAADLDLNGEINVDDLKNLVVAFVNNIDTVAPLSLDLSKTQSSLKLIGKTAKDERVHILEESYTGFEFTALAYGSITAGLSYAQTNPSFEYARLAVTVDGDTANRKIINVSKNSDEYVLAENLPLGVHTVEVVKLTERTKGKVYAKNINLFGKTYDAVNNTELTIDFYGDSITAGDGIDGTDRTNEGLLEGQDVTLTYAIKTANILGADARIFAQSGIKTFKATSLIKDSWDYTQNTADIVVVNLGTNDKDVFEGTNTDADNAGIDGATAISNMLAKVREKYPTSKIVWCYGMMHTDLDEQISAAVSAYNTANGDNVYYCLLSPNTSGGGYHPTADAHTENAQTLSAFITENVLTAE